MEEGGEPLSLSTPPEQEVVGGDDFQENLDKILVILFPGEAKKDLSQDERNYFYNLGSQGLESLMGEVARVNEELLLLEHQTRDMASQNYQIFVQSAQTTNHLKKSLSSAKTSVTALSSETFPKVKGQLEAFSGAQEAFQSELERLGNLRSKLEEILTFLDAPWTVRRCLEGKRLPEAIKILGAVGEVQNLEGNEDHTLNETVASVLKLKTEVQAALLKKLQNPGTNLTDTLQTIQLLRPFFASEEALRFRFLQGKVPTKECSDSQWRSWIFDTLTQHRAAFGQDKEQLLATFVTLQVQKILAHQENCFTDPSTLQNFLYFGESLAKVGADFRGLIVPVWADLLLKKAGHDLLQAEMSFTRNLHQFNLSTCQLREKGDADQDQGSGRNQDHPPHELLTFPPLALYCNEVLTLLNYLSRVPLPQVSMEVSNKINASLTKVGSELEAWGESEKVTWDLKETRVFQKMRSAFELLLVPHLDKCFLKVFPPMEVSTLTGLPISKCGELVGLKYSRGVAVS